MTILEAAIEVLEDNTEPMKVNDIWDEIVRRGLFESKGKTPIRTLNTILLTYTQGVVSYWTSENKLFYKSGPSTYGMLEWLTKEEANHLAQEEDIQRQEIAYIPNAELLNTDLFLEQEWHQWLYKNLVENGLVALGFGKLDLYDPEVQAGKSCGKYKAVPVGEMDMLLQDEKGNLIVIELKRDASDQTIGQICRYVGWVEENILPEGKKVFGIIIAQKIDEKLKYAIKPIKEHIFYQQLKMTVEFGESSKKLDRKWR